jgi:hypothetical protein
MTGDAHIAYTQAGIDLDTERDGSTYYLNLVSLNDLSRDTIAVPFEPLKVPAECKERDEFHMEVLGEHIHFELDPAVKQLQDQTENYPPLKALRSDGSLLFGFQYSERDSIWHDIEEEGRLIPCTVDIIDIQEGRLIARAEFPFIPDIIKSQNAYILNTSSEDYPSIQRYRIDPRIYNPH